MYILINGQIQNKEFSCVSVFDRGLTLGHGIFETFLSNKGHLPFFTAHWRRLVEGAALLNIPLPFTHGELYSMVLTLLQSNNLLHTTAAVRLTLTDGIGERGLLSPEVKQTFYFITATAYQKDTVLSKTATIVSTRRNEQSLSARIKNISYLDNILAKQEAANKGFDEAFLLNSKGVLAEGSLSNLFIVKNNQVFTPPITDGALPGVIREVIINQITIDGISIHEHSVTVPALLDADEVFITNTLIGVCPIHQVDDWFFENQNSITLLIEKQLDNISDE